MTHAKIIYTNILQLQKLSIYCAHDNNQLKIDTIKTTLTTTVLCLTAISLLATTSCIRESEYREDAPYLSVNARSIDELSEQDWLVINEAQNRLERYVKQKDGEYKIPQSAFEKAHIAPEFSLLLLELMNNANARNAAIENGTIDPEEYVLRYSSVGIMPPTTREMPLDNMEIGMNNQLGKPEYSTKRTSNWLGVEIITTTMNQAGAFEYYNDINNIQSAFSLIVGIAAGCVALTLSSAAGLIYTTEGSMGTYWYTSEIGGKIFNAAQNGGLTVTQTFRPAGMNPGWQTTVYDQNGKHVISY